MGNFRKAWHKYYDLYLLLLPVIAFYVIFWLWPLYGIQIAFKDYSITKGFWNSPWVGFEHFIRYFNSFYFWRTIKNTIGINIYGLIAGFPFSIVLALMFNKLRNEKFRRIAQTISYAPSFLSVMVVVGMITAFLSPATGFVNAMIDALGGEKINFLGEAKYFWNILVWSNIWQSAGFGTIMYTAAIASIPNTLYEAATIDGAGRIRKMWNITLPSITYIIITLLILNLGNIFTLGFEKILMMQNSLNLEASEVISTYVYKAGLIDARYSFTTAISVFNTVLNLIILYIANTISRKTRGISLWS